MTLEALYVEMEPALTAFFARRLFPRDRHLAPDLAADVFVRLLRHPEYAPSRRLAWTVARNLLTDHHQARQRSGTVCSLDVAVHDQPDQSAGAAFERAVAALSLAALDLTDDQRGVLHRRYWLGESWSQVADGLSRAESSAKKLHARALARLRRQMEDVA